MVFPPAHWRAIVLGGDVVFRDGAGRGRGSAVDRGSADAALSQRTLASDSANLRVDETVDTSFMRRIRGEDGQRMGVADGTGRDCSCIDADERLSGRRLEE